MNEEWKAFLVQAGAVIDAGGVRHFGDADAERNAALRHGVICDLSHRGLIAVNGEDAVAFLQGQLTCDMNEISPSRSRLGALCNPKGRVLAGFRVVAGENGVLLDLAASKLEETIRRLRMYVLRAQVTLEDVSDDLVRIGLAGGSAKGVLKHLYGSAPAAPDEVMATGDNRLIRLHGEVPRYLFIGVATAAIDLWRAAAGRLSPAGAEPWALLEILSGVPDFTQSDEHLPQMTNLDILKGVSFNKGCFVGQEVIARTQHLGRLKRRMYLVRMDTQAPASPGARIHLAGGGQEAAGQLLRSARHPDGSLIGLAVLRIAAARGGALRLGTEDGPPVKLLEMPYAVGEAGG